MKNNETFAHNFQECPISTSTLTSTEKVFHNLTNNTEFGMHAMGALELDFSCAGMCTYSPIYSFSEVSRGPPERSCAIAVEDSVEKVSSKVALWCGIFGLVTLICAIFSCFIWNLKDEQYDITLTDR